MLLEGERVQKRAQVILSRDLAEVEVHLKSVFCGRPALAGNGADAVTVPGKESPNSLFTNRVDRRHNKPC